MTNDCKDLTQTPLLTDLYMISQMCQKAEFECVNLQHTFHHFDIIVQEGFL